MRYIILCFISLSVGTFFGYIMGALATIRAIEESVEEDADYAERDRHIES